MKKRQRLTATGIRILQNTHVESLGLSVREIECLAWAAVGKTERQISQIIGVSEHTSEKYLLSAKSKLGAVNRTHAVAEAIRRGLI